LGVKVWTDLNCPKTGLCGNCDTLSGSIEEGNFLTSWVTAPHYHISYFLSILCFTIPAPDSDTNVYLTSNIMRIHCKYNLFRCISKRFSESVSSVMFACLFASKSTQNVEPISVELHMVYLLCNVLQNFDLV